MLNFIDRFLNKITMYRLVFYGLIGMLAAAVVLGFFGLVPYGPMEIILSTLIILTLCWLANILFATVYRAHTNIESVYITAFILSLIVSPLSSLHDTHFYTLAIWASLIAIGSKFIFAISKKHIFNPVAIAVVLTAFVGLSATWWVGTLWMLPFVLVFGLLITKKVQRFDLVVSFLVAAVISILYARLGAGGIFSAANVPGILTLVRKAAVESPLFFFAFIMLTEPLTTPPTRGTRIIYGVFVGFLFSPFVHIGSVYSTPELALVVGNVFSYLMSPKGKFILVLQDKKRVAAETYDFVFTLPGNRTINFKPGQYLEWTLGTKTATTAAVQQERAFDSRGNRRYFTLSSSPTEKTIAIGVKFYDPSSAFKKHLLSMQRGDTVLAGGIAGDFVLPNDPSKKLVFIAGGIGITPFRSMIKYLTDRDEKRTVTLFYANKTSEDIAYRDVFDAAATKIKLKTVYALTDTRAVPLGWTGHVGYIDADLIRKEVPDYLERFFYLSGPRSMVVAFDKTLRDMGVSRRQIKKDFFPGFV